MPPRSLAWFYRFSVTTRSAGPVVAAVWLLMLCAQLAYIAAYGSNMLWLDDYELVPALTGNQPVSASWLWSAHNEHRLPIPRLLLLSVDWATHDFRAGMILSSLSLGLLTLLMLFTARRLRGYTRYEDLFFPLAWLHWGHGENLLWSWQIGYTLPTVAAGALLCFMLARARPSWFDALWVTACLLMIPLCGAYALAFVPAGSAWLAIEGGRAWFSRSAQGRRDGSLMLAGATAATTLAGWYLAGLPLGASTAHRADRAAFLMSLEFMGLGWGRCQRPLSWYLGLLMVCATVSALIALAWIWAQQPAQRGRVLALLCFLAGALAMALLIGWGRGTFFAQEGCPRRYLTLATLLCCSLYFAFLIQGGRVATVVPLILALLCALSLEHHLREGISFGTILHHDMQHAQHDFQAGLPLPVLAQRYSGPPFPLYPDRRRLAMFLTMLRDAGVWPYRFIDAADKPALDGPNDHAIRPKNVGASR